jgi:hypothetical protein
LSDKVWHNGKGKKNPSGIQKGCCVFQFWWVLSSLVVAWYLRSFGDDMYTYIYITSWDSYPFLDADIWSSRFLSPT